jgi:ABC-type dipeptide/oligopeptide/nickel transport system permease subunit
LTELIRHTAAEADAGAADLSGLALIGEAEGLSTDSRSPLRLALRRFRRNGVAMTALVILLIIMFCCLFPDIPARLGEIERLPISDTVRPNAPPSSGAWFGTDNLNHDLYSRIWYGGRVSMLIGLSVAIIACTVGTLIGAIAGYLGGKVDDVLMRITDVFLAFPVLVLLLILRNLLTEVPLINTVMGDKNSVRFIVILLVVLGWMPVARIVRGEVMSLKQREFVEAARALGAGGPRIVFRHLIPNALGPIMVSLSLSVVTAILAESTLSFFGYGPQRGNGQATWGLLIAEAPDSIIPGYWWKVLFPCLALVITIVCINFIGDGLRDAFDPKANKERA